MNGGESNNSPMHRLCLSSSYKKFSLCTSVLISAPELATHELRFHKVHIIYNMFCITFSGQSDSVAFMYLAVVAKSGLRVYDCCLFTGILLRNSSLESFLLCASF